MSSAMSPVVWQAVCYAFPCHHYPTPCTLSIPVGFHLLAPSKEQHTGDVIAELPAGEKVGGNRREYVSMKPLQSTAFSPWSGYVVTVYQYRM
ncbi:hypothetical protein NQZ68_002384 [Dissostichus eleginoides]|nr:hypothetical protein NQZ68_002384 [Dissostichus eleginoides]